MTEDRALREALAAVAGERAEGHPSDDELLAYGDGSLDADAEVRIQEHLAACFECAERFLDLDALQPRLAAAPEQEVAALDSAADWRDLRTALAEERRPRRIHRGLVAAAAALAVAVVGLGVWVTELRRDVERLSRPEVNAPILYLDEPVRAGGGPEIAAPAAEGSILLVITPPFEDVQRSYEATLRDAGERVLWRGGGLRPTELGTLRLRLPARWLGPGSYELRLANEGGGAARPATSYRFTVRPEDRGPT